MLSHCVAFHKGICNILTAFDFQALKITMGSLFAVLADSCSMFECVFNMRSRVRALLVCVDTISLTAESECSTNISGFINYLRCNFSNKERESDKFSPSITKPMKSGAWNSLI
jgi:hypothetical protein